jgi:hypothetical protein
MESTARPPEIEDRRLLVAFILTALPALPVFIGAVYLLSRPGALNILLHPLGLLYLAGALLLAAIPVRLALYVFALRQSSPQSRKLWAALLCAVPALGVFAISPSAVAARHLGDTLLFLAFFGSYLGAFVTLMLHVVQDAMRKKAPNQPLEPTAPSGRGSA